MEWMNAWMVALRQHPCESFASSPNGPVGKGAWWLPGVLMAVWLIFAALIMWVEPKNDFERKVVWRVSCELRNNC